MIGLAECAKMKEFSKANKAIQTAIAFAAGATLLVGKANMPHAI